MNKAKAFTLVEILIVVVLLGVLAADLQLLRRVILVYKTQHLEVAPGYPFNGKNTVEMLADGQAFPANADDSHGWIYQGGLLRDTS